MFSRDRKRLHWERMGWVSKKTTNDEYLKCTLQTQRHNPWMNIRRLTEIRGVFWTSNVQLVSILQTGGNILTLREKNLENGRKSSVLVYKTL